MEAGRPRVNFLLECNYSSGRIALNNRPALTTLPAWCIIAIIPADLLVVVHTFRRMNQSTYRLGATPENPAKGL